MSPALAPRVAAKAPVRARPVQRSTRSVQVKAMLDPQVAIGGATIGMLTLGRFVFMPFQRRRVAAADVGPKTTGNTYFDNLQKPSTFMSSTNDPSGFTIIDVAAWGALGHALGYALLAVSSNVQ